MDFFKHCRSEEEKKEVYRTLAKCFHPDKFGNNDMMVELNRQYAVPLEIPKTQFYRFGRTTPEPENNICGNPSDKWEINRLKGILYKYEVEIFNLKNTSTGKLYGKINELECEIQNLKDKEYLGTQNEKLKSEIRSLKHSNERYLSKAQENGREKAKYERFLFELCKPIRIVKCLQMMLDAVNLLK